MNKNNSKDYYNRKETIDHLYQITQNIKKTDKNVMFGFVGNWGSGKTFVLNELIEKYINDETTLIIKYDAWEYDFYEEPLIALMFSIMNSINEKTYKERIIKGLGKKILQSIVKQLLESIDDIFKSKTGIKVVSKLKNLFLWKKKLQEESMLDTSFNPNNVYEKAKAVLKKELTILTKRFHIIFIVDELDRCLPEYSIKVLERLHHVNSDLIKTQTIVAYDYEQLEQTIQNIFGAGRDTGKYLNKFFFTNIYLPKGIVSDDLFKSDYFKCFIPLLPIGTEEFDFKDFVFNFLNFEIRDNNNILDTARLIHRKCFPDNDESKFDLTLCALEILFAYLHSKRKSGGGKLLDGVFDKILSCPNGFEVMTDNGENDERLSYLEAKIAEFNGFSNYKNGNLTYLTTNSFYCVLWACLKICRSGKSILSLLHKSNKIEEAELYEQCLVVYNAFNDFSN